MCLHARPVTQPGDKRLGLASQAFDVHVSEIVQCWALCLTLVSAPRFEVLSDFRGVVERVGITHLGMVPSMLEAMLPEGPEGLPLKYVVSGGEKISDGLIKKWTGRGGVVLANFYGFIVSFKFIWHLL
jgi:acyl-coenzyme A synthetase/AMP-(fatty) acid ligase